MDKTPLTTILTILILTSLASAITISSVTSDPRQIEPGQKAQIKIDLENNLNEDLTNIQISLDLKDIPFAPYQSSSETIIDELDEGDDKRIYFEVQAIADAKAGTYKIPVTIKYNDIARTSFISLIINSKPELKLDYEGNLIKGKNNEITLTITNTGLSEIKLLSLEVKDTIGLQFLGQKYVYIGNLDSDDFDSADFDVFISATSPSTISLPVELSYKDATNKDYKENQNLILKTYTQQEAIKLGLIQKNNTLTYVGAIVVLIILYLIYRAIRKRRKKKALEESRKSSM